METKKRSKWLGEAWRGGAGPGRARQGKAPRGRAWRGAAGRGKARFVSRFVCPLHAQAFDHHEIVKGGQGRSASAVQGAAWGVLVVIIGGVCAVAAEFVVPYGLFTLPLLR